MWTDKTSGLEFYPPPLFFFFFHPADILAISKMEGIPQEFHVVCESSLSDFMRRGSKHPSMMVMGCLSFFYVMV